MSDISSLSSSVAICDVFPTYILVDVRDKESFVKAHIDGAIHLGPESSSWQQILSVQNDREKLGQILDNTFQHRHKENTIVIVYDYDTYNIDETVKTDPLRIIYDIFETDGVDITYIQGGFDGFQTVDPSSFVGTPFEMFRVVYGTILPPLNFFLDDFMAIGSCEDAEDIPQLDKHNITHVLNVTTRPCIEKVVASRITMQIPIFDSLSQDILQYFQQAFDFIDIARKIPNAKLLIHCHAGISRSVSFAIAYVMWAEQKSFDDTFALIHKHRPCASPNLNFMGQLMIFGKFLPPNVPETYTPSEVVARARSYLDNISQ